MDAAASNGAAGAVTVATRQRFPRLPTHAIDRPRLRGLLDSSAPLTILRAPIGFGKTALQADWASYRAERETVAWVNLDEDDRTPEAFWGRVLDALDDVSVPIEPARRPAETDRHRVQRAINALIAPVTIVIDRYDASTEAVDRALVELVTREPHLRHVTSLRSHRRLPAGARVGLDTVVIGARDLRFSVEDVAALLQSHGIPDAATRAPSVHAQTDGWPALVAAMADGLTRNLSGDYVRSHLLPQIDDDQLRRCLLIASIPQPLTGEIMCELTDDGTADDKLARLESAGALFATYEDGAPTYQIPRAMRAALRSELDTTCPELAREIHTRLARRHLAARSPAEALTHALAAKNWPAVVAVINKFWGVLLASHGELLYEAFMVTPLDQVTGIRALACRDLMLQAPDDTFLDLVPGALPDTRAELEALGRSPEVPDAIGTGIVIMMALRRRGLHGSALDYSNRLEVIAQVARATRTKESGWQLPAMYVQTGATRLLTGDFTGAISHLQTAYHTAHESPMTMVAADSSGRAALAWALLGDTRRATKWLERHDVAPAPPEWFAPVTFSSGHAARALVAIDRLLPDAARSALERVDEGRTADESWAFLAYVRAQYALIWGDPIGELKELGETLRRHESWLGDKAIAGPIVATAEAELLISLGWGNQAHRIVEGPYREHLMMQVPRARVALLTGRPHDALQMGTGNSWTRGAPGRSQREMALLHTIAHLRVGELDAAATLLRRGVRRARSGHSLRVFATVPSEELAALTDRVPEATALIHHRLVVDAGPVYPAELSVVTLTERESIVLEEVTRGQTMPQIAESLYVSYNTVKSQMRSLYQKLGAGSRAEAVARARALGLLD